MGRAEGIASGRQAVVLDPLNPNTHGALSDSLFYLHHFEEAALALKEDLSLDPDDPTFNLDIALSDFALGRCASAGAGCAKVSDIQQFCLALTSNKLGRQADAEVALGKFRADDASDCAAYQYAQVCAQWGNPTEALRWLKPALRLRDPGVSGLKTDPLLDPVRQAPRFQAIERALKFPD